jgi:hypothetical protein
VADARLEIKAGAVSITGEGTEKWLAEQLDKVLAKLPELAELAGTDKADAGSGGEGQDPAAVKKAPVKIPPLATYLKDKKATTNQSRKFLATAAWLQLGGVHRLATGDVTKALSTHNQGKLTNPSQCLNNNATSGNIVKDGKKQFYVAAEGFGELDK